MSKHNEALIDDLEDPFAYVGKSKYVKKQYLRDSKTPFSILNILEVAAESTKFGKDEFQVEIEYVDIETGELVIGTVNFATTDAKGEDTPRARAFRKMQEGILKGIRYDNYYLVGSGTGFAVTKTIK